MPKSSAAPAVTTFSFAASHDRTDSRRAGQSQPDDGRRHCRQGLVHPRRSVNVVENGRVWNDQSCFRAPQRELGEHALSRPETVRSSRQRSRDRPTPLRGRPAAARGRGSLEQGLPRLRASAPPPVVFRRQPPHRRRIPRPGPRACRPARSRAEEPMRRPSGPAPRTLAAQSHRTVQRR